MTARWIVRNVRTGETAVTRSEHKARAVIERHADLCEVIRIAAVEAPAQGWQGPPPASSDPEPAPGRPGDSRTARHMHPAAAPGRPPSVDLAGSKPVASASTGAGPTGVEPDGVSSIRPTSATPVASTP